MDFSAATGWWLLAGVLVAAEMLTGTFYLLMLAVGGAAAALAAHAGLGFSAQVVAGALVGGGATAAWHFKRARQPQSAPVEANADAHLDIGQTVQVPAWGSDGLARVQYRGAAWTARHAGPGEPTAGEHVIVAVRGNQLELAPAGSR
ncbi:MAG: NfeD family protein [Rubrivivax sp.]|nr:NfeD family protein [Rubrivivax sp.]